MTRYRLTPEAQGDLDAIKDHLIQQGGIPLARHVLVEIRSALRLLARSPEAGHKRSDLTSAPVKFWSVFAYMIVYDPKSRPIGVARILHGRQDLESLFAELHLAPDRMLAAT